MGGVTKFCFLMVRVMFYLGWVYALTALAGTGPQGNEQRSMLRTYSKYPFLAVTTADSPTLVHFCFAADLAENYPVQVRQDAGLHVPAEPKWPPTGQRAAPRISGAGRSIGSRHQRGRLQSRCRLAVSKCRLVAMFASFTSCRHRKTGSLPKQGNATQ